MGPDSPHAFADFHQLWKLVEQDYTLRLNLVAHGWAEDHLNAKNALFADSRRRGNAAYLGPAWAEMEIADADKRAEWSYRACCEIWEIQGRTKCRPFFRAVFDWCLQPMFSTRESCFAHELELHQKLAGASTPQGLSAIGGRMKHEMARLRAKWSTKLEIDARDNEYQQKQIRALEVQQASTATAPVPVSAPLDILRPPESLADDDGAQSQGETLAIEQVAIAALTFQWKELGIRFREIQSEPTVRQKVLVSAEFTSTMWGSGSVLEDWRVRGDSICRAEFERLASIAARKLGYLPREGASNHWLDCIRKWMQKTELDKDRNLARCGTGEGRLHGNAYKTEHLRAEGIAGLSAIFCLELMGFGAPEAAFSPFSETRLVGNSRPLSNARNSVSKRQVGRHATRNRDFEALAGRFWLEEMKGVTKVGLDGLKRIASKLDDSDFKRPSDYLEGNAARALRAFNKQNGNAPTKKIMCWKNLVEQGDKDQVRAMCKALSRCGSRARKSFAGKKLDETDS